MTDTVQRREPTLSDLEAALDEIRNSPADGGTLKLIVRRPAVDQREPLETAELDVDDGLIGDTWRARGRKPTVDGSADPETQITLMNARVAALLAGPPEAWAEAGDQLYVDLDLGESNLAVGTWVRVGAAVLEVSARPHGGCAKFSGRFGLDALRFVSTSDGRELRLRGLNAKVVRGGTIRVGDVVRKGLILTAQPFEPPI
jgi:hypothetical protein